jgi:hypothetical protein
MPSPFELSDEDKTLMAEMAAADPGPSPSGPETVEKESPEAPQPSEDAKPNEQEAKAEGAEEAESEEEGDDGHADPAAEKRKSRLLEELKDLRKRDREKDAELRRLAEERAAFNERARIYQEMQAQQVAQQAQQENPNEPQIDAQGNPIGTIEWLVQRERERERQQQEYQQQSATAEQRNREWQAVRSYVDQQWGEATKTRPELVDAYKYAGQKAREEFVFRGLRDPSPQMDAALMALENELIADAYNRRIPIDQYLETYAKVRGWQAKAAEPPKQNGVEQVEAANTGQSRSRSLSQAGGSAAATTMTYEKLAELPLSEYQAWVKKNPKTAEKLLSGIRN